MKHTAIASLLVFCSGFSWGQDTVIRVGAKHFNEGYILSEMLAILLEDGGYKVERKFNLGGTAISFEALRNNSIDVYPEYTGTIASEILKSDHTLTLNEIQDALNELHLEISAPYGFSNTYALLVTPTLSADRSINKISDLIKHPDVKVGLSYEFMKRKDGWENLAQYYHLPQEPIALEHGLAYQAIRENTIDVTDAYSTDGEIEKYKLVLLEDDQHFFPEYEAVSFYSTTLPVGARKIIHKLTSSISEKEMQQLNGQALFERQDHYTIARNFLLKSGLIKSGSIELKPRWYQILEKAWTHLVLTTLSLASAVLIAIPLGVLIYRYPELSKTILYVSGVLQTIPSIALLALMIPLAGIGMLPAVIALFLYALLPILRNTMIGLMSVDPILKSVASAIGLDDWNRLRLIEFPLAMPVILTGIRTAAVITVGTATLAAFIGAGGLGEFIVTGLALNDTSLILMGGIPAAILAILTELLFEVLEWLWVPRHLRQKLS